jgi:hypothetical protein
VAGEEGLAVAETALVDAVSAGAPPVAPVPPPVVPVLPPVIVTLLGPPEVPALGGLLDAGVPEPPPPPQAARPNMRTSGNANRNRVRPARRRSTGRWSTPRWPIPRHSSDRVRRSSYQHILVVCLLVRRHLSIGNWFSSRVTQLKLMELLTLSQRGLPGQAFRPCSRSKQFGGNRALKFIAARCTRRDACSCRGRGTRCLAAAAGRRQIRRHPQNSLRR